MNLLQKFKKFLIEVEQPSYPPYHSGKYLEQTFLDYYLNNVERFEKLKHIFIPVFWTDLYLSQPFLRSSLQEELNSLDKNLFYFTVSQHDDAPLESLPPNTINFSAGGNSPNSVPIPLIASKIPNVHQSERNIFCSFVGSVTNPGSYFQDIAHNVRMDMLKVLVDNKDYVLKPKHWSSQINESRKDLFLDLTSQSIFTLCPRGYGATSFRLYEALQLGSIPVYIYYGKPHLPFENEIDWNKLCVLIDYSLIQNIDSILKQISLDQIKEMQNYAKFIYDKYFTLEKLGENIFKILLDK